MISMALPQSFKIMTEERICKSCGRPIDYLEYKEGNGKCYQCQPGYGGHSYTEGSEPIKITEEERTISTKAMFEVAMQAEREVTTLKNQLKQRDETIKQLKEALREERNKAIDECMREIERLNDDGVLYESTARKVLEFLKSDSK